jgi:hypothetical protein
MVPSHLNRKEHDMKLLTKVIETKLRKNSALAGEAIEADENFDPKPVVKYFNPAGAATWLITELDEDGRLFGLCDLGFGTPELGYVMLEELESIRGAFGLGIERDRWFKAKGPLSLYADEARKADYISA